MTVTVDELAADLEDAQTTLQAQSDMIDSLTLLWTTLQAKARAVVEQIEEADREGFGYGEVTLVSLRELDAASVVEVRK